MIMNIYRSYSSVPLLGFFSTIKNVCLTLFICCVIMVQKCCFKVVFISIKPVMYNISCYAVKEQLFDFNLWQLRI